MYNDHIDKIVPPDLLDKQDLPRIVIISVSVIGIFFLITNIVLVAGCILKRRAKRIRGSFSHLIFYLLAHFIIYRSSWHTCFIFFFSEQSNQTRTSATIEMCAPNSHNDTVRGVTLSSVNEKSATYSNEGSNNDYVVTIFEGSNNDCMVSFFLISTLALFIFHDMISTNSYQIFCFLWLNNLLVIVNRPCVCENDENSERFVVSVTKEWTLSIFVKL